jgi:NADPH-dependent 2,4-dienoyl-CoA reductase/sulfur reductase-like enzyme
MSVDARRSEIDVAIVGAGPAGQAAAESLVSHGLSVVVIDEQPRAGGQVLRQPPAEFTVSSWLVGRSYRTLKAQLQRFESLTAVRRLHRCSALGIFQAPDSARKRLLLATPEGTDSVAARAVLIVSGCYDMPTPLPGWTLPGVMTAGAVQTMLKSMQLASGERIVLAGTHPLMLLIGEQLLAAGSRPVAVLFAQPLMSMLRMLAAAPVTVLRHLPKFLQSLRSWSALRRAGVPVRFGAALQRIEGRGRAESVHFAASQAANRLSCDQVALCYGFLPQSDLVRMVGADTHWAGPAGGFAANHDDWMRSSVTSISVAGEVGGVRGAEAALATGQIAAAGILLDLQKIDAATAEQLSRPARRKLQRLDGFARLLAKLANPEPYLPEPDADTLICRCEDISLRTIEDMLRLQPPPGGASAFKLLSRVGMGACQGRGCEHSLLRQLRGNGALANATGAAGFTVRFPVRPVTIGDLIDD